jgi:hypothetical protein
MEDHAIKPLEDVAAEYAHIRDERMDLTQREHQLKTLALALMKKFERTIYRHGGIEITVVPGEDDVKVRLQKPKPLDTHEDDPAGPDDAEFDEAGVEDPDHAEFAEARRAAVEEE